MVSITQFRVLLEQAEALLEQFEAQLGAELDVPVPATMLARQLLGLEIRRQLLSKDDDRIRGTLAAEEGIIYVDPSLSYKQFIFTVAHETGHYVLHEGHQTLSLLPADAPSLNVAMYLASARAKTGEEKDRLQEIEASMFAAALLLPRRPLFRAAASFPVLDGIAATSLARQFNVSLPVVIYHVQDLVRYCAWEGPPVESASLKRALGNQKRVTSVQPRLLEDVSVPTVKAPVEMVERGVALADYLHTQRQQRIAHRNPAQPYVMEFAGTPNAGKDTLIEIAAGRLKHVYRYRVEKVDEIVKTYQPSNRWQPDGIYRYVQMTTTRLMEAVIDNPWRADFIFLNRSVFDTLAFLQLHLEEQRINKDLKRVLTDTLLAPNVVELIDQVLLFLISPDEALQREEQQTRYFVEQWTRWDGLDPDAIPEQRVLQKQMLSLLNCCYRQVYDTYYNTPQPRFSKVDLLDFTHGECPSILEVVRHVANVFPHLEPSALRNLENDGPHNEQYKLPVQLPLALHFQS